METIRIDRGVDTALSVDLTNFDFTGIRTIVLTVKNHPDISAPAMVEYEFDKPTVCNVIVTAEQSLKIEPSAVYDICKITTDGNMYKITENGKVILRRGVGDKIE